MSQPNGRTVLITGANRGIGRAAARRFADEGWTAIGTSRGEPPGEPGVRYERCDVREPGQLAILAERLRASGTQLDVLVNNAAIFENADRNGSADALDPDVLRRTLDVNVVGTVNACVALLPLIPRGGRIINLSSELGQFSRRGGLEDTMVAYSISKTAVNAYTAALARALRERGISVNSVHPGWVKTDMGGPDAHVDAADGAARVYDLATREDIESGRFWKSGKPADW